MSAENWPTVKEKTIWATVSRATTKKIVNGDLVVFFVKGTGRFKGAFRFSGDWYQSGSTTWPDEIMEGKRKYPFQIRLKKVQIGEAEWRKLIPKLQFVKVKSGPNVGLYLQSAGRGTGPANWGRPIAQEDFDLIVEELKSNPHGRPYMEDEERRGIT